MDAATELGTWEMLWPDKQEGPWILRLTFGIVNDRPGVIGVELYAVDPSTYRKRLRDWMLHPYNKIASDEPITTSGIRLPLAQMTADYLASTEREDRIISQSAHFPAELRKSRAERLQAIERVQATEARRGPGRPAAYGTEHYERVAATYLRALQEEGRPPTKAVAEEMAGGYPEGKSAAGKWIAKCRELGLLPPTVKGKAAGWPVATRRRRVTDGRS